MVMISGTTMQMPLTPMNFTLKYLRGYIWFYVCFTTIFKKNFKRILKDTEINLKHSKFPDLGQFEHQNKYWLQSIRLYSGKEINQ